MNPFRKADCRLILVVTCLTSFWSTSCSSPTSPFTGNAALHYMLSIPEVPLPVETEANRVSPGFMTTFEKCHDVYRGLKYNFNYILEEILEQQIPCETRGDTLCWVLESGYYSRILTVVPHDSLTFEISYPRLSYSYSGWINKNMRSGSVGTDYWSFEWYSHQGYRDWYFSPRLGYVHMLTDSLGRGGRLYEYDYGAVLPVFQEFFEATWDGQGHGWSWAGSW